MFSLLLLFVQDFKKELTLDNFLLLPLIPSPLDSILYSLYSYKLTLTGKVQTLRETN